MGVPGAYISFDYLNNETEKILFFGQSKICKTSFSIADWSCKSSLSPTEWDAAVKEKINNSQFLIVLVGKNMSTATEVEKEIKTAKELNIPFFGVYVGGANTNSDLPNGLNRFITIEWDWKKIADAIDQVMREGKNKK